MSLNETPMEICVRH